MLAAMLRAGEGGGEAAATRIAQALRARLQLPRPAAVAQDPAPAPRAAPHDTRDGSAQPWMLHLPVGSLSGIARPETLLRLGGLAAYEARLAIRIRYEGPVAPVDLRV
jgi:hypothetical protein